MEKYFVYAVYNQMADKIYVGQTGDIAERVAAHNDKRFSHSFTSRFNGVWVLIYKEVCSSRSVALTREKQLKSYRGRQFVKSLIPE